MPSKLRLELDFTILPPAITPKQYMSAKKPSFSSSSPNNLRKQALANNKMSLTQTYRVASLARNKLGREALQPDHDLRLLVGHANLLDSLMLDLANAERQQEAWFNSTLRRASKPATPADRIAPKHVQWIDTVAEAAEEESEVADNYDSDSESDDDDILIVSKVFPQSIETKRRSVSPPPAPRPASSIYDDLDDDAQIDDEEMSEEHALVRVASNSTTSSASSSPSNEVPPVPALEYGVESDDESPLPSPAKEQAFAFFSPASKKQRTQQIVAATDLVRAHLAQQTVMVA